MELNNMQVEKFGKNLPEKKYSAGAISATIWRNEGKSKDGEASEYFSVGFDRKYKDKEGNWKTTSSLRVADLPKAVAVLNLAYQYLVVKDGSAQNTYTEEVIM